VRSSQTLPLSDAESTSVVVESVAEIPVSWNSLDVKPH
jgi:hypothetical protein